MGESIAFLPFSPWAEQEKIKPCVTSSKDEAHNKHSGIICKSSFSFQLIPFLKVGLKGVLMTAHLNILALQCADY